MLETIKTEVTRILMQVEVSTAADVEAAAEETSVEAPANVQYHHAGYEEALASAVVEEGDGLPKVGRNDPCPCGSGKKYKQCHGRLS